MDWLNDIPFFLLVFVRITCFFIPVPIFMMRTIPNIYKIGLSFFIALIVSLSIDHSPIPAFTGEYLVLVLKESLVGLGLGFIAFITFSAIQLAGTFIDLQSGFSMGSMYDPQSGTNVNLTGRFKNMLATLFLLSVDGHHLLIQGVLESYNWIGVGALVPSFTDGRISTFLLETFEHSFMIAFLIAAPIVFILFLVDVILGIIGKTTPQINLLVVGFPLKTGVYLIVMFLLLPGFFLILTTLFSQMFESVEDMIRIMGAA
ncbi:flagellar biosynthetic protein FliR [Neobacillus sp. LXY-4]|uniref:flagellar biosynthetic protein FliR n=1 Tax=Neobacillus sp. LXY-4 TaxID=3379826 RepID=UPI003EDF23F0